MARDNKKLGTFHLDGIAPAPRGTPQIEVTFDIDANGILHVSAKDLGTGKEQKISITGSSGLSKEEVERMQREAELHAEEDRKAKDRVETRNNADNLAYQCEKALKDAGDKFPADKRSDLQTSIDKVRDALKGSDEDAIKSAHEELQTKFQAVGEELYKNANPGGATADAATAGTGDADAKAKRSGKDDDVIDAEFEDLGKGGKS